MASLQLTLLGGFQARIGSGPALPLPTRKAVKFLFVGGTIHRKGIDVLLEAYRRAFTAQDMRDGFSNSF